MVILKQHGMMMNADELKTKLKEILSRHGEIQTNLASSKAQDVVILEVLQHVNPLIDENESLWNMLDEIKASDVKHYSEEFRKMMDQKLIDIKMLAKMKPEQA